MHPLAILQLETPLSPVSERVMVAVFVAIFIAILLASRRLKRSAAQPTGAYAARTGLIFSVICVVWGGAIWVAILMAQRYDNVLAMIAASSLLCIGLYYLVKGLRNRGHNGGRGT